MDQGIINTAAGRVDSFLHDLIAQHYLLAALVIVILLVYIYMYSGAKSEGFNGKVWATNPTSVMDYQKSSAGMEGMVSVGDIATHRAGEQKNQALAIYNDPALSCRSGDVLLDGDDPFQYEHTVLQQEVAMGLTEGLVADRLKNGALAQTVALTGKL